MSALPASVPILWTRTRVRVPLPAAQVGGRLQTTAHARAPRLDAIAYPSRSLFRCSLQNTLSCNALFGTSHEFVRSLHKARQQWK